mmetsp:Transcript_8987/g.17581  ORF Transcript_8987/g.17581 Transcript_8987/m.17581 type:complete len:149 (-) Transcript_8987:406-852(-)|eukprot:CAMPEP_0170168894 /NCGR_PEP_ID=MMETSP0040_2-20121228/1846_1 /TAXON_ID=641309 /ORGANISM="Lotharella oceanica, Strain CCMP622" /LENGTH=148 /DNA_ID=CAMNT_0010407327 /DNA_START=24 /DNA_END=470 /DNA_ORIENTATION=-
MAVQVAEVRVDIEDEEFQHILKGGRLKGYGDGPNVNWFFCICSPFCLSISLIFSAYAWITYPFSYLMDAIQCDFLGKIFFCSEALYLPCIIYYCCCPCHTLDDIKECGWVPRDLWARLDHDEDDLDGYHSVDEEDPPYEKYKRQYTTM